MSAVPPTASDHPERGGFDFLIFHAETRPAWRAWLAEHHATERGVWLCSWKTPTGRPRCPYPDAVEEAICFGWIDSTAKTLDAERGIQLMTPRKPKSSWTRLNRERVANMEAAGLMTDAGRRVVEIAQANGYWTIYDSVEDLIEPPELTLALDAEPAARAAWDAWPPSARKQALWQIVSAARPETVTARIASVVATAARGDRP